MQSGTDPQTQKRTKRGADALGNLSWLVNVR